MKKVFFVRQSFSFILFLTVFATYGIPAFSSDAGEETDQTDASPNEDNLPPLGDILPLNLSASEKKTLRLVGKLTRFHSEGFAGSMTPGVKLGDSIDKTITEGNMNMGIEALFFTPYPLLPALYAEIGKDEKQLVLYNILRSVRTLEGLEYYSASRGNMRLLIAESWTLSGAESDEPVNDILVQTVPEFDVIYTHQKDMSFGTNRQKMTLYSSDNVIWMSITNLTPLRYKGIIKIAGPGHMQIHLVIMPVDEGLLVYGVMAAQTLKTGVFANRARNSFTNRLIALSRWCFDQLEKHFDHQTGA